MYQRLPFVLLLVFVLPILFEFKEVEDVSQQPSNTLIPIDTIQFCNQIGDQACLFANSNMKILFNQTIKDSFDNWLLNREAQNIGPFTMNNVMVVWHLYDAQGNVIGLTQGFPMPSKIGIGKTTLFNLQEKLQI